MVRLRRRGGAHPDFLLLEDWSVSCLLEQHQYCVERWLTMCIGIYQHACLKRTFAGVGCGWCRWFVNVARGHEHLRDLVNVYVCTRGADLFVQNHKFVWAPTADPPHVLVARPCHLCADHARY